MESSELKTGDSVRVAVNIRPLITPELEIGCTDIITVVPGEPQVQIGSHTFTYDFVYGSRGISHSRMYDDCVGPLVDALFHGYNATVLAYGQTGSGKTYTMGTNYSGEDRINGGIIPRVMEGIFNRVEKTKGSTEFLIRVSFIEIFKEEVFDLLDTNSVASCKLDGAAPAKAAAPARVPIQIRETLSGGITLAGVTEPEVRTKEEMGSYLSRGSSSRATGSTNMNRQSSRSHAIFTITMEQKKISHSNGATDDGTGDDILYAKLHLVDLAGSERAKRTGADGMRLKEGIHINKGLLALGNVISALGDEKKRKEGGHVPYRDSKLTRLLQDSLGGNSKTVMIACVSPADTNAEETLNTLKYANRARNIQNKAVINRDPMASQMERMRNQIEQLQSELIFYRGDGCAPFEEFQILKHKIALLEASNAELQRELQERRISCQHLSQKAMDAEIEKDKLIMTIKSARNGKSWDEIDMESNQDKDVMKSYVSKIQQLEGEILRLQNSNKSKRKRSDNSLDSASDSRLQRELLTCDQEYPSVCDTNALDIEGNALYEHNRQMMRQQGINDSGDDQKELEHSSLQEMLDRELKELDQKLEQKEAEMKRFANVDTSVLKQHYEKKVHELEQEKRGLQKEIEELRHNLAGISSTSDDGAKKLKEEYLQKLNFLEAQVAALKKKQDAQAQILRQKQKSDEAARRLQDEIQRIKSQKVQLQQKIKQESEQFRLWKASREKEVLQLKKEGRRNEYEMHKLLALNQRQKMVLQRKAEEAALATKRLKELLDSRKASSREASGAGSSNSIGLQALMQAIEHELEVTVRVHEVRLEYERQMGERAKMAKEVARLKEEAQMTQQSNLSDCPQMSPGARRSRIFALENMLTTSSSTLISMASQLSDAEERERTFSGKGRWNQIRSLGDAKNIMNYLFNLASSSRCQLRDKEVESKEKELEVRDLKEKVVKLNNLLIQVERQKAELTRQNQMLNSEAPGGCRYQLRKQDNRRSIIFHDDMDTSDSENSDIPSDDETGMDPDDHDWVESVKRPTKKRNSKVGKRSGFGSHPQDNDEAKDHATDTSGEEMASATGKNESGVCCSCSKWSSCKTSKCECRAAGGICSASCSCASSKCSNREVTAPPASSNSEEALLMAEKNGSLAFQGAQLLQSALSKKPTQEDDDGKKGRKPLSDIGNTVGKSNAAKPSQRKKWRKSAIQLVTVPPPSTQPEINVVSEKPDTSTIGAGLPPKLPRSIKHSVASDSGNLLRDRNSGQAENSTGNKEVGVTAPPSPANNARRTSNEKENHGC